MDGLTYILDTNVIGDRMKAIESVSRRLTETVAAGTRVYLCQPVYYEVMRGLLKTNATRKLQFFQETIMPLLYWLPLADIDWEQAAQFWADARNAGKQLSDVDLLIAAIAYRTQGVIVSDDDDFDALPIKRENWREKIDDD
jgi:tRNA(fMet)-specific endonuclease VapC